MLLEVLVTVALLGMMLPIVASGVGALRRTWAASEVLESRLLVLENVLQQQDWAADVVSERLSHSPSYNIVVLPVSSHDEIRILVPVE
jgi:hypothetical protein